MSRVVLLIVFFRLSSACDSGTFLKVTTKQHYNVIHSKQPSFLSLNLSLIFNTNVVKTYARVNGIICLIFYGRELWHFRSIRWIQ
jgi:hypothetical protein